MRFAKGAITHWASTAEVAHMSLSLPSGEELLPIVYDELRRLAAARLAQERPGQTLQATALVHEAYLRLGGAQAWSSRAHFFAAAAEAMRRILVEHARARRCAKRGGGVQLESLDEAAQSARHPLDELLDVHDALDRLEQHDPQAATLVKLRFFAGFEHQEAADMLGISRRAADRLWLLARTWLHRKLDGGQSGDLPEIHVHDESNSRTEE